MDKNEIDVPAIGTDNAPLVKYKNKPKKVSEFELTPPGDNTGSMITWERYPIGRNAEKKVVKDYLENKLSKPQDNKSYPDLAEIGLEDLL